MANSKLDWDLSKNQMPEILPHTVAKHQIISAYIEHLIITLYGKTYPKGVTTFTFIDGFCGGGIYQDGSTGEYRKGSPILLIEAVREGFKKAKRLLPINVKYIFIDSKKKHIEFLKKYSFHNWGLDYLNNEEEHVYTHGGTNLVEQCEFITGNFEDLRDYCLTVASCRKGHSFFLLDPAGWDDVSLESIQKINDIPKSEILYTHMIEQLKRFVIGKKGVHKDKFEKVLGGAGYYEKSNLDYLDRVGEQMYLRNETARLFREKGFKESTKRAYLITFALIPKGETQVLYYLIHMSRNITALEVIKERFCEVHSMDYQYQFEVYGYCFRTSDLGKNEGQLLLEPGFYELEYNTLTLNVDAASLDWRIFIPRFDKQIAELIYRCNEGITFIEICEKVGQFNPASRGMYEHYLNFLRENGDIEVVRNGSVLTSKNVKPFQRQDVIRVSKRKIFQTSLLYKSRFSSEKGK